MTHPGRLAQRLLTSKLLNSDSGLNALLLRDAATKRQEIPLISPERIYAANLPLELQEKDGTSEYPAIYVYCEDVSNELNEKFQRFSGTVQLAIEARATHDTAQGLSEALDNYVDALTGFIEGVRGRWAEGVLFPGPYALTYGPVKRGGRNYVQSVKCRMNVFVSY